MTEEERIRELTESCELTDVLAAPKPKKEVQFDYTDLEVEKAEKEIEARKEADRRQKLLSAANNEPGENDQEEDPEVEYADQDPKIVADSKMSAETYMIYYELAIKLINQFATKQVNERMSEKEMDTAAYLQTLDEGKRTEEQNLLIGRYLRMKEEFIQIKEDNNLTQDEYDSAYKAVELICRKRNWNASPEMAAITVLGQQLSARLMKIFIK